jgi:putative two-component system response regulator
MNRDGSFGKILVVDDQDANLDLLEMILTKAGYDVVKAKDGIEAMEKVDLEKPDLILLDLRMPRMDGFEVLRELKSNRFLRLIPVIVLTAYQEERFRAFEAGADDFLSKPLNRLELLVRIKAHMRMASYLSDLEHAENVLFALARFIEARDAYTEEHTERVTRLSVKIAEDMGLYSEERDQVRRGALLHDIGKIGVPDQILLKPGPLNVNELELIKRHVIIGYEICRGMRTMHEAIKIIKYHHERWDGNGYPEGLEGERIPLSARIVAVSDAFDAMVSNRPYRIAYPMKKAMEILEMGAGAQWDPDIVKKALELIPEVYEGR